MAFKAIIFDFNGVLWWDAHLQEGSWRQFAVAAFGATLSKREIADHVHGRTNQHTLEYLAGRPLGRDEVWQLTQQKETIYRQMCLDQGPGFSLSPGATELLGFLVSHGVPRTIATASEGVNVGFFVEHLGLGQWFDVQQIVYDDGSRPGKPAPDIYLQAARNLGLEPAWCVVVEDSSSGIRAARAAGIGHIVALGPVVKHDRLLRLAGVCEAVESLGKIPKERLFLGSDVILTG
jgi:beta-phosphoglucomutase-like phosphatase (HAD superfamily)